MVTQRKNEIGGDTYVELTEQIAPVFESEHPERTMYQMQNESDLFAECLKLDLAIASRERYETALQG